MKSHIFLFALSIGIYNVANAEEGQIQFINTNSQTSEGLTVLLAELLLCNDQTLESLLKNDAVKINEKEKGKAVAFAIVKKCSLGVEKLINAGADVNVEVTTNSQTSLHWAADKCSDNIVERLITAGANVNARTLTGWSPLHYAAASCKKFEDASHDVSSSIGNSLIFSHFSCINILQQLIEAGSDPHAKAQDGLTPLQIISFNGDQRVIDTVLDAIGKYQPEHLVESQKSIKYINIYVTSVKLLTKIILTTTIIGGPALIILYICRCCCKRLGKHSHVA